jgi:hypothetical protein
MATSRLERELGRRKRKRAPELVADPAAGSAPGVPPIPNLMAMETLRRGLPSAPAPGMLPNRPPMPVQELPAPGVPSPPINVPFPNRPQAQTPAPASAPIAPMPRRPSGPVEQMVPPAGRGYGLTNFQGTGPDIPAVFENARAQSQSQALNPTFQPTPLIAPNSPHATASPYGSPPPQLPDQSYADQWKNLIPTGKQFSTFGGPADPRGGPVDGPVPSWFGNAQRGLANKVFQGVGTAIDRTAREVNGIVGAPFQLAHQLFTPGVQLEEEAKAAQAQAQASHNARHNANCDGCKLFRSARSYSVECSSSCRAGDGTVLAEPGLYARGYCGDAWSGGGGK